MRNLLQHPITQEEKLSAIRSAIDLLLAQGKIGDIRPAALREVLKEIEAKPASTVIA